MVSKEKPSQELLTRRPRAPHKVGVCMEFAGGTNLIQDFYDGIRLAFSEAEERGDVDRAIELVIREVRGPMRGTSSVVVDAWRELVHDEDCLAVIGPVVTEANLALVDEVNRTGVPTISFCATFDWAGPYAFALQNGGFPDEAVLLAGYLASQAITRVALFREDGIIGEEYGAAFRAAARRYGLTLVTDHVVGLFNTYEPVEPVLRAAHEAGAECVLVLSAYGALIPVRAAVKAVGDSLGWNPVKVQNTTWVAITAFGGAGDYDQATLIADFDGWIGLDQVHEGNRHFQDVLFRFEKRFGRRPFHAYAALGFDHGFVVAGALARMRPPSAQGLTDALERTRMVPACIGGPGTVISFGPHDHRGYKGDYVVLRTIADGVEQLVDVTWAALLATSPLGVNGVGVNGVGVNGADGDNASHALSGAGTRYSLVGDRTPFRIGVLQDWALWAPVEKWYDGLRLAFAEAFESGLLDREVELVFREVEGPPDGRAADVVRAWRDLVHKEKVLGVVGPFITDLTRILRDEIERTRVPVISYCATTKFAGDFCFQTPNGTFADETFHIARHLLRRGVRRVGVVREDNPIGDEYYDWFRLHARTLGLQVTSDQIVSPRVTDEEMDTALRAVRASGAQGLAHLGYGLSFYAVLSQMARHVSEGWDVPRVTITTWVLCSGLDQELGSPALMNLPAPLEALEGWVGVDLPHEGNKVFQGFQDRYVARFGGAKPYGCYPAHMYDMGRVLAEGIARARPVTPEGLAKGLEKVRMVPATMGAPGTVLGFGPYDHRGYKGSDYLVLRTVLGGREGLVEELMPGLEAPAS
ncbi:ABC transporter substrate-binding protein [Frankia sp. Cppng1_Ct_nod]|uniref:ABC transporter substrate-binding protein n=1 Tax=Frankia sp. Cppng1_Ct_nod TaxID=2897162 RepID=UPI001A93D68A|nr:ABC transporter substrate-binding protein [Frankia sp. Cppng1_Ct_nod]